MIKNHFEHRAHTLKEIRNQERSRLNVPTNPFTARHPNHIPHENIFPRIIASHTLALYSFLTHYSLSLSLSSLQKTQPLRSVNKHLPLSPSDPHPLFYAKPQVDFHSGELAPLALTEGMGYIRTYTKLYALSLASYIAGGQWHEERRKGENGKFGRSRAISAVRARAGVGGGIGELSSGGSESAHVSLSLSLPRLCAGAALRVRVCCAGYITGRMPARFSLARIPAVGAHAVLYYCSLPYIYI